MRRGATRACGKRVRADRRHPIIQIGAASALSAAASEAFTKSIEHDWRTCSKVCVAHYRISSTCSQLFSRLSMTKSCGTHYTLPLDVAAARCDNKTPLHSDYMYKTAGSRTTVSKGASWVRIRPSPPSSHMNPASSRLYGVRPPDYAACFGAGALRPVI